MKKRIILIIIVILGVLILNWLSKRELDGLEHIMKTSPDIDSITVKDSKTNEELLTFSNSDPAFTDLVNVHETFYILEGEDKKIVTGEPVAEVNYYEKKELKYTLIIYQLEDGYKLNLEHGNNLSTYQYTPSGGDSSYVISIKDTKTILSAARASVIIDTLINKE
ncbi:hypothetical protein ACOQFO_03615 [Ureibacillus sp. MALMAid1270]|uniref:hypothetical protein n=1 Tax=Ureibacillus sp. MALMAid1270 TaxID=3411629 RepID=UPI003BA616EC